MKTHYSAERMRGSRISAAIVKVATCLAVAVACAPAVRTAPLPVAQPTPKESLRRLVDSLINQPQFRTAQWGVLVLNPRSGDTLVSRNAGKLFMPASNMKIVTSAIALAQLGPDYRYRTTFGTAGIRRDSTIDGDLLVIGRGDPTVSDRMRGNAMLVMDAIADSLSARGIRRVTGSLSRFGNAFPDTTLGYGWEWDDLGEYYGSGVDELIFNEGMAPTTVRADGGRDSLFSGPAKDLGKTYLEAMATALARHGITVAGGVSDRRPLASPAFDTLFTLISPPLREILPALMKPSQNQIAELLFKTVALERGGAGTADSARKLEARQLLAWGALSDGFLIFDGSGLSRHDLVTPETIVRIHDVIQRDTAFAAYYASLPVAGVDGTIRNRMKGTPAEGNVHAKTGTLSGASSLSGYVTDADGERLIFTILCNNFVTPTSAVTRTADVIAAALASFREARH